ncbi:2-iminobutanoate/2-iminopropanoate deaminase [Sphingopyxis panaciterrae]|uniref:RidA family protein n=1 Tax=Sphingopyxis panaciterrae TaxID=363841 RepID=UPI00141F2854|nr:RidA family protein [Sphingopyxis panaciterrae]NIJ38159.1 2-iminobutanoate/2-iminopropanoate deaminase [Sphingopyxis panaciterrae]
MNSISTLPLSMVRQAGDLVFISGQLSLEGGKIVGDDIVAQTDRALDGLAVQLTSVGLDFSDVVKTNVWITSKANFAGFNTTYAARFTAPYPARSTVISDLVLDGALVEIDAVAQLRP